MRTPFIFACLLLSQGAYAIDEAELLTKGVPAVPEPGDAGKRTLAGIDSNHNAVRDDLEKYLLTEYGNRPKALRAVSNMVIGLQAGIVATSDETSARAHSMFIRSAECYRASGDLSHGDEERLQELMKMLVNTPERTAAMVAHQQRISEQDFAIQIDPAWDEYCNRRADHVQK